MDVVCVIDLQHQLHLGHRKHALEDVRQACTLVHANLHHIQVWLIYNAVYEFLLKYIYPINNTNIPQHSCRLFTKSTQNFNCLYMKGYLEIILHFGS